MQPFMSDDPEEIAAEINRRADLQNAAMEDAMHRRDRLIMEDLDDRQLLTLAEMLSFISTSENPVGHARYYQGTINAVLKMKFGICPGCGAVHEDADDFLKRAAEEEAASAPVIVVDPPAEEEGEEEADEDFEDMLNYHLGKTDQQVHEDNELIVYNMERRGLGLYCRGCGTQYPSMADRMIKGPDDCHHCHEKAKHG